MTARLDGMDHYGDFVGGSKRTGYKLSDPRLDHKLQLIPPHTPTTDAQRRAVAEQVHTAFPVNPDGTAPAAHLTAREELLNMILAGELP